MRPALALVWIVIAALEVYRHFNPELIMSLGPLGLWMVMLVTAVPIAGAVWEFRRRRTVDGIKTAFWSVLGLVTLAVGPVWLRLAR